MGPHNVCPSSTTTYIAIVTDNNGDTSSDTIVLVVNPLPTVVAGADVTICAGSSNDIQASGAQSYSWDNGVGAGAGPHSVSPTTTTVYTVTGTDVNGCVNSDDLTVTVDNTGPVVTTTATDASCFGDTDGTATASATGNGPFTYSWTPSGGNSNTENNLGSGNYSVEVTDDNGCVTSESVNIDEPTEILLTMNSTDTDCSIDNGTASVSASGGNGTFTYLWSPNGETTSSINNLSAGTYSVIVEDQNGCQQTDTVEIETANSPVITVDTVEEISCPGADDGSITVNVSGGNPGYTYSWSPSGDISATANNLASGQHEVTVTDNAGCSSTEVIELDAPTPITLNEVITNANCGQNDGTIQLNATGGTGQLTYNWDDSSLNGGNVSNLAGGAYSVEVVDDNGCSVNESYSIQLVGEIPVVINPDPAVIEFGDEIQLESNVGSNNIDSYTWSPSSGLSCDDCPDPIASPAITTTYYLTVTSDDGCVGTDSTTVIVNLPCEGAFLPSMFSPNNDGINDDLCVLSNCVKSLNLEIFNRWGELVFHSTDQGDCWDGTFKSKAVNSGVFVYKLNVVLTNLEVVEETGTITVVL
jgi:gliding motility-associated-like protein